MPELNDVPHRLVDALADRYRIEGRLGEGGMATVYLAHDLKHDRRVALKVLKPELAAVVGAERFLAEIRTTANLQHPNILPLFDSGEVDGQLFYVMPYVEGESLRDRLDREKQLPIGDAVRVVAEVAEALQHAHRHGVVHRDIKPANILLRDGRPLVADFGIALAVGSAGGTRLTETGLSLGTPFYMSPEQATGDQGVSAASDIYALGCVLYEMLAGEPPHRAATAQAVLAKIITGEVPAIRDFRPTVPDNVEASLRHALERIPADRFDTALAFAEALRDPAYRYGDTGEVETAPAFSWRTAGLFVGLGLLPGLLLGQFLEGPEDASPVVAAAGERPLQLTFSGRVDRSAISPQGDFAAYVEARCAQAGIGACRHDLKIMEVGSSRSVELLSGASFIGTIRWTHTGEDLVLAGRLGEGREGIFVIPRLGGTPRLVSSPGVFDTHPSGDSLVVFDPGDSEGSSRARVLDLTTGETADEFQVEAGRILDVAWSPDGERLALGTDLRVVVADRSGAVLDGVPGTRRPSVRWNVDGDGILVFAVGAVREDDLIRLPVAEDGRLGAPELVRGGIPTRYLGEFDVARSRGRVAVVTGEAREDVWSFDLTTSPVAARRETAGTTWYGEPSAPRDGIVYYLRGDALGDNVYALNLETGEEEPITDQTLPGGSGVRLSSDGRLAATTLSDSAGRLLQLIEFPSRRVRTIPLEGAVADYRGPVPLSPGRTLLAGRTRLVLVDDDGSLLRELPRAPRPVVNRLLAVSPDGETAAAVLAPEAGGYALGLVGLDESGSWRVVAEMPGEDLVPGVTWTADGLIHVGRWRVEDSWPSLWQYDPARDSLRWIRELPAICQPQSIAVAPDASRAVCLSDESRMDIWIFEGLGR